MKSVSILKRYYKLVDVKPLLLILELLALFVPSAISIILPVFSAKLITSLTVYDYSKAMFYVILDFALLVVSTISYFLYHIISTRVNRTILTNLNHYVYGNLRANENIKSVNGNIFEWINTCSKFNTDLLYKTCFFIKSIILLGIIMFYNFLIALVLVAVSLVSFMLKKISDRKIQKVSKQHSANQAMSLALLSSIQQGKDADKNYTFEQPLKDKYFGLVENDMTQENKISLLYCINNNLITLILKTAVFLSTLYLIGLIKSTSLTLSVYLVLTPYLTSSAQNLISFFELFTEFGIIENTLSELDSLEFTAEKPTTNSVLNLTAFNIYFYNVTAIFENQRIKNLNCRLTHGKIVAFVGKKNSGKRVVFKLLNKEAKPELGAVLIDNKNIFDLELYDHKKIVASTSAEPFFYNISVAENLYLACPNKTKIKSTIRLFGLKPQIDQLPEKENSLPCNIGNKNLLFFLGLARCFLQNTKIICIYELPPTFTSKDFLLLKKICGLIKKQCTIIFFVHSDEISEVCDSVFYIENGTLTKEIPK